MSVKYAQDLPAGVSNYIEKVAIVGVSHNCRNKHIPVQSLTQPPLKQAGGNVGKPITKALLATGKHTVTALSRAGSTSTLPEGVKVAQIDYDNEETIVNALKGQDYLVITMNATAPPETHHKLVAAASKAGIKYVC